MAIRRPSQNPLAEDVLVYNKTWIITVLGVDGGTVRYRKSNGRDVCSDASQPIEDWRAWAGKAKVKSKALGSNECVVSGSCAGPCMGRCGKRVDGQAHLSSTGIFCGDCCKADKHGK